MNMKSIFLTLIFIISAGLILYYQTVADVTWDGNCLQKLFTSGPTCKLKLSNPWDPAIFPYMSSQPLNCKEETNDLTYFDNGFVMLNKTLAMNKTACQWRCLNHISGNNYVHNTWEWISKPVDCDIFNVKCFIEGHSSKPYYNAPYFQIKPKKNSATNGYSVHILVLDSTSRSHAIRSLPKSLNYLEHELSAFDFRFFNKVGYNSNPNGHAAFIGKQVLNPNVPSTLVKFVNDSQTFQSHYIGNIFERGGYAYLLSEDVYSVFYFDKVKPMHMLWRFFNNFSISYIKQCYTMTFNYMLKALSQFNFGYGSKPKFSLTWNTVLSHNGPSTLFAADDMLVEFLIKQKEELDNSFFILMADHGPTYGYYRFEDVVAYEDNNPVLFISLPKSFRTDAKFVAALNTNTKKLVTQYDVYATLIEIAKMSNVEIPKNITLHGQNLFQELPDRDCFSMGISPAYCLCRYNETLLAPQDPLGSKIIKQIFEDANKQLYPLRNDCIMHELDSSFEPIIIQVAVPNDENFNVYKVTFQTKYFIKSARWWTYVYFDQKQGEIKNMLDFGNRIDPYGMGKRCNLVIVDHCYCKNIEL